MRPKNKKIIIILAFLVSILPLRFVRADMGPKPTMDFSFSQAFPGDPVSITGGTLFECEQTNCGDAEALMEGGPQRFTCQTSSCHALAYGFKPYHRLDIQFSDGKTRQSNIFATAGFDSTYTVTIQQENLLVEAQLNPTGLLAPKYNFMLLCTTCLLCLVVLAVITALLIARRQIKIR